MTIDGQIRDYASKVMVGTRELILQPPFLDYVYEVQFMQSLAGWLSENGWPSRTKKVGYPNSREKADLVSVDSQGRYRIVIEAKQYILDYPTRPNKGVKGRPGLSQQHLGILPGKDNNAVYDIICKLPCAEATHIGLLLVRVEHHGNRGHADIAKFVKMASLDSGQWATYTEEWLHPTDPEFFFNSHLWIRPLEAEDV